MKTLENELAGYFSRFERNRKLAEHSEALSLLEYMPI